MSQLGLNESELRHTILAFTDSILARGLGSDARENTKVLAEATQRALRQVATAIVKNNERIAKQLKEAGVNIT